MLTAYVIEFLFFGFFGWLLDSTYRLILDGRFLFGGYLRWMPIRPIYGTAGVLLIFYFKIFNDINPFFLIIMASVMMVLLEYISAVFCQYILGIKLWDYSDAKFNIGGKVDLLHSVFWFILVSLFYNYFFKLVLLFESNFDFPQYLDLPVFWLFIAILVFSTIKNHPALTFGQNQPAVRLYIYDYHKFAILLNKFHRAKKPAKQAILKKQLQPYLKMTGISLKNI